MQKQNERVAEVDDWKASPEVLKKDPDSQVWKTWQGSVLLKDEIKRYCKNEIKLITPFDEKELQPAGYRLHLGSECRVNGEDIKLSDSKKILRIPRHSIAIIRTLEKVNIPGFLIGRWNLKVKMVYKGLVWVGSLQVEPGYQGYLFCPLYNLSSKDVELVYGDPLFTIDFVRTTIFDEAKGCELWEPKPHRAAEHINELDPDDDRLQSAPAEEFKDMKEKLKEGIEKVEKFQSRIDSFQVITFAVLGILVAALAFISVSQFTDMQQVGPSKWQISTWIIVFSAILALTGTLAYAAWRLLRRR